MTDKTPTLAFALRGLTGRNAHGAGFLQAALATGVTPDVISCTSGQIYWVYNYLKSLNDSSFLKTPSTQSDASLRMILKDHIENIPSGPIGRINQLLWGNPGEIEANYVDPSNRFMMDAWSPVLKSLDPPAKIIIVPENFRKDPPRRRHFEFPDALYEEISLCFNQEDHVGILFNSYNPVEGSETVYLNRAAGRLLNLYDRTDPQKVKYREITAESVRESLSLYGYGLKERTGPNIGGEYFRPVILRELAAMDRIIVVRPVKSRKTGTLPSTRPQLEEIKAEIGINAVYAAEKANIEIINSLIEKGYLRDEHPFHPVTIQEVNMETNHGIRQYTEEDLNTFDTALAIGEKLLAQLQETAGQTVCNIEN